MTDLTDRIAALRQRLATAYDSIGHSHGRPYVYVVYPPTQERTVRRLIHEEISADSAFVAIELDVLPIILQSTAGSDARREALLADPDKGGAAAESLFRLWARAIVKAMDAAVAAQPGVVRPVLLLIGLGALHPLGTPTTLMETIAEQELRHPTTGAVVPVVLFVPGVRPPQTSREYLFLGQEQLRQMFYRGEEA